MVADVCTAQTLTGSEPAGPLLSESANDKFMLSKSTFKNIKHCWPRTTAETTIDLMQQLAEPLFILHCVFLHCMNEIESVVKDFYPDQYSRNTLRQPFSCCNNLVPSTRFELVTSDF